MIFDVIRATKTNRLIFRVKFTFRRSKRSNNGTDVSAGQIPELLYMIPTPVPLNEVEVAPKPKNVRLVQNLSKHFTMTFKEVTSGRFFFDRAAIFFFEKLCFD